LHSRAGGSLQIAPRGLNQGGFDGLFEQDADLVLFIHQDKEQRSKNRKRMMSPLTN
jgi:replicative DNA helicase